MTAAILSFADAARRREALRLAEKVVALPRVSAARRLEPGTRVFILRSNTRGDMFIELAVETPVNLSTRQKELLREFEELGEDNNPESHSFFSSVKNFWDSMKG